MHENCYVCIVKTHKQDTNVHITKIMKILMKLIYNV